MTEKVVSLSGGLVLGMVFALFLGIGATQTITTPVHFNFPEISQLTIAQGFHTSSSSARDTTPGSSTASPDEEADRGRITRIATLTTTTDPAIATAPEEYTPKNWNAATTPKIETTLQMANLQHSRIAAGPQTSNIIIVGQVTGYSNFTTIAENTTGGYESGSQPSIINGKPQTQGSPGIAHNKPGFEENWEHGEEPEITSSSPSLNPGDDTFPDNNTRENSNWERPCHNLYGSHGSSPDETHQNSMIPRPRHRPGMD